MRDHDDQDEYEGKDGYEWGIDEYEDKDDYDDIVDGGSRGHGS